MTIAAIKYTARLIMCSPGADAPYEGFYNTGDDARTQLPNLQAILNAGKIRTLIWAGDLDFNCNEYGIEK